MGTDQPHSSALSRLSSVVVWLARERRSPVLESSPWGRGPHRSEESQRTGNLLRLRRWRRSRQHFLGDRPLQLPGYIPSSVAQRFLIAQLPNGSYLFQEYAAKKGSPGNPETFLVISSTDSKSQTQFPQKRLAGTYHVSPSGKYLAYVEERRLAPNFQPEPHLWGQDLQSGEEKELFVAPPPNPPTSLEPNVVLTVLGWSN